MCFLDRAVCSQWEVVFSLSGAWVTLSLGCWAFPKGQSFPSATSSWQGLFRKEACCAAGCMPGQMYCRCYQPLREATWLIWWAEATGELRCTWLPHRIMSCTLQCLVWLMWWWIVGTNLGSKPAKQIGHRGSRYICLLSCTSAIMNSPWRLLGSNYSPCHPTEPPWQGWEAMLLPFLNKAVLWGKSIWAARHQSWQYSLLILETNLSQTGQVSEPVSVCDHSLTTPSSDGLKRAF